MPKIHRIRIVGLKYDGMQKQYEDTTFDFHNAHTSTNGLIAMMNGGGKGVFLQTIFQVLKPGTAWGKQNNRYYQQFFFNKKEQFVPYTFHVLIEWELDGSDQRFLVTGGMFSAEQRFSLNDENTSTEEATTQEGKIVPNITFYAREFDRKEDVALEHIPLYENGVVAETEELKDYFKWNGYDVYRDLKKHYRILDTYGINRKDWEILKDINKDEGGVGKYFEGAEDDHSLFQKRIIPTVSQVLQRTEHQKNDLIEIFKSQASIAKDLPILLKREQAHKEFLEDIIPFEHHIKAGVEHKEIVQNSTQEGQQLLGALEHTIALEKEALQSLETELEKLQERTLQLRFEKDNLEYAKAVREVRQWEQKLLEEKEKHEKAQQLLQDKNELKDQLSLSLLLKEWSEMNHSVLILSQQIEKLEQTSGLEQVNSSMKVLKAEASKQWEEALPVLQSELNQYASYKRYMEKSLQQLVSQDKQKTKELAKLESEINALYEKVHEAEMKEAELVKQFGDQVTYDLNGFINRLQQKKATYRKALETCKQEEKQSQEQLNHLSVLHGTLEQTLVHIQEKRTELTKTFEEQQEKEKIVLEKLRSFIEEAKGPLSKALLSKYANNLQTLITQNRLEREQLHKELWETQLDLSLNDENYWIANQDVKELKEWIDEKTGIDVFYGTQYLQSLKPEERAEHLENYPLLPFGLVVSRMQWQKINQQVLTSRMFKSAVPIYMREEMTGTKEQSFVVIHGMEANLLKDREQFDKWKLTISEQIAEQKETLSELEKSEETLRRMMKEIDLLSEMELCVDLKLVIEQQDMLLAETRTKLQQTSIKSEKEKEKQLQLQESIHKTENWIDKCSKDEDLLSEFEKEKSSMIENKRVQEEKQKQKEHCVTEQQELEKEHQRLMQMQTQWNQTFLEWKLSLEQEVKEIVKYVESAQFPAESEMTDSEEPPSLSIHVLNDVMNSIAELNLLQKSKEEQAQELLAFQARKEAEAVQQGKLEKKLRSFNKEWKELSVPDEPINIIEEMYQSAVKDAKEASKAEREQGTAVTVAETSLQHAVEQSEKAEKKVTKHEKAAEAWENEDLEVKEVEIKDQIKLTKVELKKVEKQQKETEASKTGHEGDQLTLSVILKEDAAPFMSEHLEKIQSQGKACIIKWCDHHQHVLDEAQVKHAKLEQSLRKLKLTIEEKDWEIRFKNEVLTSLDHMDTRHYEHVQTIVKNMKAFSSSGLEQLDRDKERAEKAQDFWASRASMKVMSLAEGIRSMIAKMKMKNERTSFPLVQLKEDILPKKPEEVEPLLKQHFVTCIDKITRQFEQIDDQNKALEQAIQQMIGDEQILFASLRNRYPELLVYNMRTDNAFMYGKPQKEHYSTWKTINQGSRTKSDGSGGQKLSARMVMMMMLLSVKSEHDQSWVPLVCDNPFGQAASAHVLDPIFAVAEKLKFQLIVVTPPELVKTEISQRFEAYYKLDFIRDKGRDIVTDMVVPAYRIYQGEEGASLL